MRKNSYIIVLLSCIFCCNLSVSALTYGGCEYSEISRLKSFVSNVNLSYDYYIQNNVAYFSVTLNNIIPDVYFIDSSTGQIYNYNNTIDGEIVINGYTAMSGHYRFYSAIDKCYGVKLSDKYYNFPTYNYYYTDPLCQENQNSSLCQKWSNIKYSYDEFKSLLDEYNKDDSVIDDGDNIVTYEKGVLDYVISFYIKYYYIILGGIIAVCITIMIISRRKNRFDL